MKKSLLLFLLATLAAIGPARAVESLTVNDGTGENTNIPIYGFYGDEYQKTAFIIPQERTAQVRYDEPEETVYPQHEPHTEEYEFDLSDITHNPQEPSREDIIAAAEAAAFAEKA